MNKINQAIIEELERLILNLSNLDVKAIPNLTAQDLKVEIIRSFRDRIQAYRYGHLRDKYDNKQGSKA